mgnify:CR=1 FL=1
MGKPAAIAIDGPASSGKTTIGSALASRLGYLFFDTGVVYRAATLAALRAGVTIGDEAAVTRIAETMRLDIVPATVNDGRFYTVLLDGKDVTWELRGADVDANVSPVSAYPGVRRALLEQQRRVARRGNVVVVGRDIGTVILPEAELKIYLDASAEERAHRRYRELTDRGIEASYDDILRNVQERDRIDSGRSVAPLQAAADAHHIDTTDIGIPEVLRRIEEIIRQSACKDEHRTNCH